MISKVALGFRVFSCYVKLEMESSSGGVAAVKPLMVPIDTAERRLPERWPLAAPNPKPQTLNSPTPETLNPKPQTLILNSEP